ncbi:hypothetical protein J3F83DRAFT_557966 [Trichoderma novae-zelandiae]
MDGCDCHKVGRRQALWKSICRRCSGKANVLRRCLGIPAKKGGWNTSTKMKQVLGRDCVSRGRHGVCCVVRFCGFSSFVYVTNGGNCEMDSDWLMRVGDVVVTGLNRRLHMLRTALVAWIGTNTDGFASDSTSMCNCVVEEGFPLSGCDREELMENETLHLRRAQNVRNRVVTPRKERRRRESFQRAEHESRWCLCLFGGCAFPLSHP